MDKPIVALTGKAGQFRKEIVMRRMIIVTLAALLVLAQPSPVSLQQDADYSRESRAAIGAHHLCSGLWVVGRVYKRTPEEVLAQDIAPFQAFGWEESFKYTIDSKRRRVTVSGPGAPPDRLPARPDIQGAATWRPYRMPRPPHRHAFGPEAHSDRGGPRGTGWCVRRTRRGRPQG